MWPRCCWSPEEYSLGVIPSQDASSRGLLKRAKSPISAISPSAVRVERPRKRVRTANLHAPALGGRDLLELGVERVELAFDAVEVDQHLLQGQLREPIVQSLHVDPAAMLLRPRRLALAEDAAVAQQLLEHAVTRRGPRAANVVAAPEQVTQSLKLGRRRQNEAQQAGAMQPDELLGVTPVGLDAIAGPDRDQRRRDDVARHPDLRQQPPQREPAGPRLIADRQASRPPRRSMKRRTARSVVSIRDSSGLPPTGGSVAATIENLCTSRLTHRRTSAGAIEVTSGTAGPPSRSYAVAVAAHNTRDCQPAKDATHEDQPHASMLTRVGSKEPRESRA